MTVSLDQILCRGGLDQITPTMSLPNSYARFSLNFEPAVTGGYARIAGYERFDGHLSPADTSLSGLHRYITVAAFTNTPAVGATLVATGGAGAGGVVARISGLIMVVAKVTGTWAVGQTIAVGATPIGTVTDISSGPVTPEQDAIDKNAVADIHRADIAAVPGKNAIRGVVEYRDTVYAFRDNNATPPTYCAIYKSTTAGWVLVPFLKTVSFTAGLTEPAELSTLTEGGVTARIRRVVRVSGSWSGGTAAGQFIIDTLAGGNFSAGAATTAVGTCTLSGIQTDITLLPGGRYEFEERNFAGQAVTNRLYGCDGVNKAFEFDGEILAPISTGATTDTPTHIVTHKGYLFLSLGSSVMHSAPGLPFDWTALGGAAELATGDTVTGMVSMPGGTSQSTLGVFNRSNTLILYGTSPSDWNLTSYNTGTGAVPYSLQNMAQTYAFDDRGVNAVTAALQYGNFAQTALTNSILPFINQRINLLTGTTLCRRKSQYRLFFSDGYGVYITVVNSKLLGCMPVYFPNAISCCYEGKSSTGADVIYFGSTDGMVYQMEKGTSFDGAAIDFTLAMNFSNAKSPRTLKRYRKCVPEITSVAGSFARFSFSYMLGYDSVEYSQPADFSYDKYTGLSRWDSFVWDNFFWDTKTLDFVECYVEGTAENFAALISGSYDYIPEFTINSFLVHYTPRRMMR